MQINSDFKKEIEYIENTKSYINLISYLTKLLFLQLISFVKWSMPYFFVFYTLFIFSVKPESKEILEATLWFSMFSLSPIILASPFVLYSNLVNLIRWKKDVSRPAKEFYKEGFIYFPFELNKIDIKRVEAINIKQGILKIVFRAISGNVNVLSIPVDVIRDKYMLTEFIESFERSKISEKLLKEEEAKKNNITARDLLDLSKVLLYLALICLALFLVYQVFIFGIAIVLAYWPVFVVGLLFLILIK